MFPSPHAQFLRFHFMPVRHEEEEEEEERVV